MKKNANRGAGLVTVVVVLAVAGILLSGALWLAFTHYKSAMKNETAVSEQSEVELCAELVCMTLNERKGAVSLFDLLQAGAETEPTALQRFYQAEKCIPSAESDNFITIQVEKGYLTLSSEGASAEFLKCLSIRYFSSAGQPIAEKAYTFTLSDGEYVYTEYTPESTEVSQ